MSGARNVINGTINCRYWVPDGKLKPAKPVITKDV